MLKMMDERGLRSFGRTIPNDERIAAENAVATFGAPSAREFYARPPSLALMEDPAFRARTEPGLTAQERQRRISGLDDQREGARRFDETLRAQRENTIAQFLAPKVVEGRFRFMEEQERQRGALELERAKPAPQPEVRFSPDGKSAAVGGALVATPQRDPPEYRPARPVYDRRGNLLYVEQADGTVAMPRAAHAGDPMFMDGILRPGAATDANLKSRERMSVGPISRPPATSYDSFEGRTATGPNGQRIIFRNGQWVPLNDGTR